VVGSFERHAQNKAFHAALADAFTQTDRLRLYFLEADGDVVAALYGYEYEGRFAYYQSGFDPRWGRHSVGSLLLAWTIDDCIARGIGEFDFLRGDETYKRRWAHSDRTTRDAVIWNDTVRGRLHLAQKRAVAAVKSIPDAAARLRYCLSSAEEDGANEADSR
jgi:CelD/BcsL family acetyltransferase involved in cellulose biosynthesis